jgi:hypothetical protein
VPSTIGQVQAGVAEEGPDNPEGAAEVEDLPLRVQDLDRLFQGRQGEEEVAAEVHPVAAEAPPFLVRLVHREAEAALPRQ